MLVLSRKRNQDIQIGSAITIRVLSISGKHIRLGIDCPKEIPVMRSEVDPGTTLKQRPDEITAPRKPIAMPPLAPIAPRNHHDVPVCW